MNSEINLNSRNDQSFMNNCKDWLSNLMDRIPIFVRSVIFITLVLYLINLLSEKTEDFLSNTPTITVNSLKLWTIFTSCLINTRLINLIFAYLAWIPDGIRLELSNGTIKYILNFFINNSLIQFSFILVSYLISTTGSDSITKEKSLGLWPVIMSEITMLSISKPDNYVNLCFIPYEVQTKFYPFVIYLLLFLVNGFKFLMLDVVIGIAFGYLYFYQLKHYLNVSDNFVKKAEKLCSLRSKISGKQLYFYRLRIFKQNNRIQEKGER